MNKVWIAKNIGQWLFYNRTTREPLNLKPYSTTSCNVPVTHEENAVGLVKA